MANEYDLRVALAEVFAADTSTGPTQGLTVLCGNANPIVRWGDRGMNDRPIVAYYVAGGAYRSGVKDALRIGARFDVFTEANATGLAEKIADRIEAVVTNSNLSSTARTTPVDVAPYPRGRRELPELDEGRNRIVLEYDFWFNR